ncbi:hypothetical protein [Streptomyces spectabilis]|uniref:Uncharacterized protein n=1 Tax=Streptomyces spectabilis TaxID=68270 RepID=A0A7W8AW62_STRST|nr:hypothetical protein [Streptomyces spectabilis]MBB5105081.1 hypothetical protein [Streptomyces spectabilis]MCI3905810.1 hypothetical protein [Streptomyces spectabilis]
MSPAGASRSADVTCPGCGAPRTVAVDDAAVGRGLRRRLARAPLPAREALLHAAEGALLVALTLGWAAMGRDQGKPLYVIGALALTAVVAVVTSAVVRGDLRGRLAVRVGAARADPYWKAARHCPGCDTVFCPRGTPWRGALTPEQFKKLVWTQGGYADRLAPGDGARAAEVPPGTVAGRG